MALLHYQNLVDHRPDMLMTKTFYGLKSHNDYLTRIQKYLESDEAVLRLSVRKPEDLDQSGSRKSTRTNLSDSVWVELGEPDDLSNVSEKTFEAFLDSDIKEVYETGLAENDTDSPKNSKTQNRKFVWDRQIKVLDRDVKNERLLLERMPVGDILLRPNTYQIKQQLDAIRRLQNAPSSSHRPLLRLFEDTSHAEWPRFDFKSCYFRKDFDQVLWKEIDVPDEDAIEAALDWMVLTDKTRPGTTEQRLLVLIALETADFALLEGPPGSGKTTAICELILQLVKEGKRVLLCASTHVATDNVIERLMDESNPYRHLVIPLRIGAKDSVSEKTWQWSFGQFVKTESRRINQHLQQQQEPTESQRQLQQNIQNSDSSIERMVLDSANLVCGTTIGLLQHPDIKSGKGLGSPQFDVMIIDEASKTTFHEFLVPALHAKRWILVGDPKQLSPYVDDSELALNIKPCLPKSVLREACVDVFLAKQLSNKKRRSAVVEVDTDGQEIYVKQAAAHDVMLKSAAVDNQLGYASIVTGDFDSLQRCEEFLPLDITTIRTSGDEPLLSATQRRADAYATRQNLKLNGNPSWEGEIAWRQARRYEQRFASKKGDQAKRKTTLERLDADLADLLPVDGMPGVNLNKVKDDIDSVRRVALPSVLECIRLGFERSSRDRNGCALTDGLPEDVLDDRRVLLSYQHRMHPDIAEFSHQHIYHGDALISPKGMAEKRAWGYSQYTFRAEWVDVKGQPGHKTSNKAEASEIIQRLEHFDRWAGGHSNGGKPWEVAVLCFYRGQEDELQQRLQKWTGSNSRRHFQRGDKSNPYLSIQLCTVDRFQGHEADLVFLSFSNNHVTSFLESPNRLNVALTRARYQLVIVGNRHEFRKSESLVGTLAKEFDGNKWSTGY